MTQFTALFFFSTICIHHAKHARRRYYVYFVTVGRWGLCEEALGRWDEALGRFETASALLQPGTALLRTALEGGRRAKANRDADRKASWVLTRGGEGGEGGKEG